MKKYVKKTPVRLWAGATNHTAVRPFPKAIPSKIRGAKIEQNIAKS